jgi:hypothetical protein
VVCLERLLELAGVAEGGRHQHEGGVGQREQRELPGDAALAVGVVVELVHDDVVHFGGPAVAQGHVGEDLRGAADDRGVVVDAGVAGQHADVLGAEVTTQGEELLADERLDRAGVERAPAAGHRRQVHGDGDQRLARAGRRIEDHVAAGEDLEDRLLLGGVELEAVLGDPVEEDLEQLVAADRG